MDWWSLFWSIAWSIWLARNAWVFEGKAKDLGPLIDKAVAVVGECEKAVEVHKICQKNLPSSTKWCPPPCGTYKLNCDAAVFEGKGSFGDIVRDHVGDVMMATTHCIHGLWEVDVLEALTARHGLKIGLEAGLTDLVLETDNLKLYYALAKRKSDRSMFGSIIRDIVALANQCSSLAFSHIRREGNGAAHVLAKMSRFLTKFFLYIRQAIPKSLP